jgi:ribosome small subunit-dependent GTPase A
MYVNSLHLLTRHRHSSGFVSHFNRVKQSHELQKLYFSYKSRTITEDKKVHKRRTQHRKGKEDKSPVGEDPFLKKLTGKQIFKGMIIEKLLERVLVQRIYPIVPDQVDNMREIVAADQEADEDNSEEDGEDEDEGDEEEDEKVKAFAILQDSYQIDYQHTIQNSKEYNLRNFFYCLPSTKINEYEQLVPGDYVEFVLLDDKPEVIHSMPLSERYDMQRKQMKNQIEKENNEPEEDDEDEEEIEKSQSVVIPVPQYAPNQLIPPYPSLTIPEYHHGMIISLTPRINFLQRPHAPSKSRRKIILKKIASNIQQLFIIIASRPIVPIPTIDRYIVAAKILKIPQVHLVINKFDFNEESQVLFNSLKFYEDVLQTPLLKTSIVTQQGIDELKELLHGQNSIFVGQSGVGKSSLINLLLPHLMIKANPLISNERYGAHTTSNAKLYHFYDSKEPILMNTLKEKEEGEGKVTEIAEKDDLMTTTDQPSDEESEKQQHQKKPKAIDPLPPALHHGIILDSPGVREMGTWHLTPEDILRGYEEIEFYSHKCKFSNCNHLHTEENMKYCAVVQAVQDGKIHIYRYNSFLLLLSQLPEHQEFFKFGKQF